jgi:glutamyl-tRNA(Gln) amidotransferase subunit E
VAARAQIVVDRRLRAAQSELGETDAAVQAELRRMRTFRYIGLDGLTSLVELDEEPPHPMSEDALDVALTFAALLDSRPADEVHVMRKTVIDGSNTSGFQRTALIATGGTVRPPAGETWPAVSIWTVALEEDSARKLDDQAGRVTYTLDRLGIPLIEVATGPDIRDPQHAQQVATRLGALLRATGRVKRGLGTIRQDLNVSIAAGDRVEIKGCQDLRAVGRVIERECRRQLWFHFVAETLRERGFAPDDVAAPVDASASFAACTGKVVQAGLKSGGVWALALPKWTGLIAGAAADAPRYGREFADHAAVRTGVAGVFHSDELPAYGIGDAEVDAVRRRLKLTKEDAFVLCVEEPAIARRALEAVAECARDALAGAGRAVRAAQPDDSTRYMRPLPGAARMYPETDVPPTAISRERLQDVRSRLPPLPEARVAAYAHAGLSAELAAQIVRDSVAGDYDRLVHDGVPKTLAARLLLTVVATVRNRDAVLAALPQVAALIDAGRFTKEAIDDVVRALDAAPSAGLDAAVAAAGAHSADAAAVDDVVRAVVAARLDFVREHGAAAVGPLMGPAMAKLRGKADGSLVSERLGVAIAAALAGGAAA